MAISLVVAMDRQGVIGFHNQIPWRVPADLWRFKALTMGNPIIMGRKTFQSIGKPLWGRTNIVVTRDKSFSPPHVQVVHSLQDAFAVAELSPGGAHPKVIGGSEIYAQALPFAETIYLTLIDGVHEGDAFFEPSLFPLEDSPHWELARQEPFEQGAFITLTRRSS